MKKDDLKHKVKVMQLTIQEWLSSSQFIVFFLAQNNSKCFTHQITLYTGVYLNKNNIYLKEYDNQQNYI